MSLAASAKRLVWRHSSRGKAFLKTLEQLEAVEAAPLSGDDSFVEPKIINKSLQVRMVDPVNDPGWDHVVTLHRDAGCFHTSAWAKVLHQTYHHRPFYLQFSNGRRLAALIPLMEVRSPFTGRRGVSLPFSDACEPLIFDREMLRLVRDRLVRFAQERRWKHLEIRGGKSLQLSLISAAKFYAHTLDLRGGTEKLDFGRTEQENEGLRRFKLSWNTQEETIDYFRVDPSGRQCLAPARSHDSGLHKKVFGRLPLMFNRLAGSMIYPHLG